METTLTKTNGATALTAETRELSTQLLEECGGYTGLEEADGEDYKLPLYTFNMKWKDPKTGRPIPPDVFFHTVTEEHKPTVRCVLLRLKKANRMATFIDGVGTKVLCRSLDRITGVMEDGSTRLCQGCPDFVWRSESDGKGGSRRVKPCGVNYHFIALDLDTEEPFVIRVKGTSVDPVKSYLNRHFLKKRRTPRGLLDVPLFVTETLLSLKMSDNMNYAILSLEKGQTLPPEKIRQLHRVALSFAELDGRILEQPESEADDNLVLEPRGAEAPTRSSPERTANRASHRDELPARRFPRPVVRSGNDQAPPPYDDDIPPPPFDDEEEVPF
jgi:hypothetical protein